MRHSVKSGHESLHWTDMMRKFMGNEAYYRREIRRQDAQARQQTKDGSAVKKRANKHDKQKLEQQKYGYQLCESMRKYDRNNLEKEIDKDRLKELSVRYFKEKGIRYLDNDLAARKAELMQQTRQKRDRKNNNRSKEDWAKRAEETLVDNDVEFIDPAVTRRQENLDKLASASFWEKITVSRGFFDELPKAIPSFSIPEGKRIKKATMKELKPHLERIVAISERKVSNTIDGMLFEEGESGKYEILEHFLKLDATQVLDEIRNQKPFRTAFIEIMTATGTIPNNRYEKEARETPFQGDQPDQIGEDSVQLDEGDTNES